ncbi:MAG: succinylglutamate desuccinylase [Calditrichaeota bacterium]|nr:succinylglutamate desuccinylase [Calditrichota bacterium]
MTTKTSQIHKTSTVDVKALRRSALYSLFIGIAVFAAGADFVEQRRVEPLFPSFSLSQTRHLSDYLSSLRNTHCDTDIYIFNGRQPGGTALILGGTHPNEPAGYISAVVLVENLAVEQGRIIVIPRANASAFTATEPQEAFPAVFTLTGRRGKPRLFRIGSRFTNLLDGWPDPIVYRHHPSGQILSGNETRNLNRAYPGRADGTLTERTAYAIAEIVRREKVDLVIDLHEAAPEYPVIDALVAHERAMNIAAMAIVDLQMVGLDFRLEPSPPNFHGLIHRELGDFTGAQAMLLESAGALQGRLRGATNENLVIKSKDPFYTQAARLGKLQVPFPPEGIPLEVRVGRHLEAVTLICKSLSDAEPAKAVLFKNVPDYQAVIEKGVGFWLQ